MNLKELEKFRLVGGTALSLLFGHRASIDLDLFTDEEFDQDLLADILLENFPLFSAKERKSKRMYFTYIDNVKVDFVNTFERFCYPYQVIDNIRFASVEEIIALKLNAIAGRGAKKDFWDLYEILRHYSFDQVKTFYHKRYPNNSLMMIMKSMTYFVEADQDDDPHCFQKRNWETIKKEIVKKFNTYIKNLN